MSATLVYALVIIAALFFTFPSVRSAVVRGGKVAFYLTALAGILSWAMLKALVILAARRLRLTSPMQTM